MRLFKNLFDFYIKSSLHVSFCYVAFYLVVSFYNGFTPVPIELVAVGSATLAGYNVAKYVHLLRNRFQFHKTIKGLTILSAITAVVTVISLGVNVIILFGFCAILTSLYSLPEILGRSFRQIPVIKLITIGVSWSVLAVLLPRLVGLNLNAEAELYALIEQNKWSFLIWEVLEYSLFIIALCIPFEIRDLKYDSPQLRTLPQLIGAENSKLVGYALLITCGIIEFTQYEENPLQTIATLIVLFVTAAAIGIAGKFKSDYYASFFVESIPLIWLAVYVVLNN